MSKYDFNFKIKVVRSYLNGDGGYRSISKQHGNLTHVQVKR
ncbi:MAG: transposase [Romboutsia sp.]